MKKNKLSTFAIFIASVMLMITAVFFVVPNSTVFADETKHKITFAKQGATVLQVDIEHGSALAESDIPSSMLPEIGENELVYFMYTIGSSGTLLSKKYTGNPATIIIENVTDDIYIYAQTFKDPAKQHKVVFNLPDGSQTTLTVYNGEDCPAPDYKLGFCERAKYSASLKNVREDMTVDVTVDKTLKYVFVIGCGTILLAGIVVIVVIILKLVNTPEDDDDENLNQESESSQSQEGTENQSETVENNNNNTAETTLNNNDTNADNNK